MSFFPERETSGLFKIAHDHPGQTPKALKGSYTSEGDALKAIKLFHEAVRARAKPVGKAKERLKNAKRKDSTK